MLQDNSCKRAIPASSNWEEDEPSLPSLRGSLRPEVDRTKYVFLAAHQIPNVKHSYFLTIPGLKIRVNPVPKILGSRDLAKSHSENPEIENFDPARAWRCLPENA